MREAVRVLSPRRTLLGAAIGVLAVLACSGPASATVSSTGAQTAPARAVTLKGTVLVRHADVFRKDLAEYWYWLKTPSGRVKLSSRDTTLKGLGRARVIVHGTRIGSTVRVKPGGIRVLAPARKLAASATASGTYKLAVFLINFQDDQRQPWTTATAKGAFFTNSDSMAAYYKEQSFGKVTLTGDILGWYTVPYPNEGCYINDWASAARNLATQHGVNLSSYTHFMYVFGPPAACGWQGLAYVPGTTSWINGTIGLRVVSHEFGHNLGVHHASSLSCWNSNNERVALSTSSQCGASEYGDPFDVMGTGLTAHMNNFHKLQYGWFGSANVLSTSSAGTYTLVPIEQPSSGIQVLAVPRNPGWYFYLEYRRPFSVFDNFAPTDPVVNGVSVRIGPDPSVISQSFLIDTTPATFTYSDSALAPGQTVTDPVTGVSFKTESVGSASASVHVSFGGQPPTDTTPPSAPGTLTGSAVTSPVGAKLTWGAATDNVAVTGYRIYRGGTQIGITSALTYTDSSVTAGSTHSYYVRAYDAAGNIGPASNTVSVTVPGSGDTTKPSAPTNLAGSVLTSPLRVQLTWTASTDNVGVTGYRIYRGGNQVGTSTGTTYTDSAVTGGKTYSYFVRAYDAAGNIGPQSTSISVTTPGSADTTPPSAPGTLTGQGLSGPARAALSWGAATDNVGVTGYRVYRGGVQVATSTGTAYTDYSVTAGASYQYSVRAYDAAGNLGASSNTVNVTVPGSPTGADLSVTGTDSPDPVVAGNNVTYMLTISNAGPASASGVGFSQGLSYASSFVSVTSSQGACSGGVAISCSIGTLAVGGSVTVTVVAKANSVGTLTSTADVYSATTDTVTSNNSVTISTTVSPGPPPPPGSTVNLAPSAVSLTTGALVSGGASNLAGDDGSYYVVGTTGGASDWYGRFTSVPSSVKSLTVTYNGHAGTSCTRILKIWNWYYSAWVTLSNTSMGTSDATTTLSAAGLLSDYVSLGEVRVGLRCFRTDGATYNVSNDFLRLTYTT